MSRRFAQLSLLWVGGVFGVLIHADLVSAQTMRGSAASTVGSGEIIVTARKRQEVEIATLLVMSAVRQAEPGRRAILSLDNLARLFPS